MYVNSARFYLCRIKKMFPERIPERKHVLLHTIFPVTTRSTMALSKNQIKLIHSLELKKYRKAEGLFLAEGPKLVGDLLGHFPCRLLLATSSWLERHPYPHPAEEVVEVTADELRRASLLKAPQQVLALFALPPEETLPSLPPQALSLALDGVQDPGNLGTILRLADWFGIERVFCSPDAADVYNPKCVQATMGALARVKVCYTSLPDLIRRTPSVPVYGTLLDGDNLYQQPLTPHGVIVMGNEGNGLSAEVRALVNRKLYIPNFPAGRETSESLNVAIATAIVCAEFRRQAASE